MVNVKNKKVHKTDFKIGGRFEVIKTLEESENIVTSMMLINVSQALSYWHLYEDKYEQIQNWIKDMEKQVKDCPLRSTKEEKQEQLQKYQVR